jgi:hypothetical protein
MLGETAVFLLNQQQKPEKNVLLKNSALLILKLEGSSPFRMMSIWIDYWHSVNIFLRFNHDIT